MIRQQFDIKHYWKVIVYYNVDYNLFNIIEEDMLALNASKEMIESIYKEMSEYKAKAVTYSNLKLHASVVMFNYHISDKDYINSLVHEAEHIKQAMLKTYNVDDEGEPPAYTIGYLIGRMWPIFKWL